MMSSYGERSHVQIAEDRHSRWTTEPSCDSGVGLSTLKGEDTHKTKRRRSWSSWRRMDWTYNPIKNPTLKSKSPHRYACPLGSTTILSGHECQADTKWPPPRTKRRHMTFPAAKTTYFLAEFITAPQGALIILLKFNSSPIWSPSNVYEWVGELLSH